MQWLIDLIIEAIGIPPVLIDRGDPAAPDFTAADLTEDDTWRDLDLSAIAPENAQGVSLDILYRAQAVGKYLKFRKKGNVNEVNIGGIRSIIAGVFQQHDRLVSVDENRFIQYKTNNAILPASDITVKGWWL